MGVAPLRRTAANRVCSRSSCYFVKRFTPLVGCAAGSEGSPDFFRLSLPAQSGLRIPSYSYTPQWSWQGTFLAYCFKHVTGAIVSRNDRPKGRGASSSPQASGTSYFCNSALQVSERRGYRHSRLT